MLTNADIGRAIDQLRLDRGLSKKKLAEKAGEMDPGNLVRIIKGKQEATTARLELIAAALDVRVWEIYRLAEEGIAATKGDPRKTALHALIDTIDPSQLDSVFRRRSDVHQEPPELPDLPDVLGYCGPERRRGHG